MAQEYIEIRGARENNLKDVSLSIPKRQITIFTGVSGSGKSSLVFDTIAAEAQRLLNENFSMFVRTFLPRTNQPQADDIRNLGMAVIVDQKQLGGGSHSTVGTVTDIAPVLRRLFAGAGRPAVASINLLSFNNPQGMCPECNGMGQKLSLDYAVAFDMTKSINTGALKLLDTQADWSLKIIQNCGLFDNDKPLERFTPAELRDLYHAEPRKIRFNDINLTFEGVVDKFTRKYITTDLKTYSERTQKAIRPLITMGPCPACHGARLSAPALACKIGGYNIADLTAMQIDQLVGVLDGFEIDNAAVVTALKRRLDSLVDIGLGYLTLDRLTDSLSGGESQRVKLVKHLGGSLVDVMYVFDEPSVGLHPRDVHRLNELLAKLRDQGNTVLVVEHDPDVIKAADHVVDVGPAAGTGGGQVVYEGSYQGLLESGTLTGRHLGDAAPLKTEPRVATGALTVTDAHVNNLKHVTVDIPTGVFTVVTGVAGSGKSSLINEVFLKQHPDAVVVDQSPVGTSSRSNPATYTGIMDVLRKTFAAENGVDAGLFSFNSTGACQNCKGAGFLVSELAFLDDAKTPCDVCDGKRFKDEVLEYKYKGLSITDVLALTMAQARDSLDIKAINQTLRALGDVGLDYLTLGQPLSTLSGGECQRIKLAGELHKRGSVYVLDEPTTGLHPSDITRLQGLIDRLVDQGNTVITIEHNLDIIRRADWIIDLGPEGGDQGGRITFQGTPVELARSEQALIARYL